MCLIVASFQSCGFSTVLKNRQSTIVRDGEIPLQLLTGAESVCSQSLGFCQCLDCLEVSGPPSLSLRLYLGYELCQGWCRCLR